MKPLLLFPFFVERPTLQIDSMFLGEKPFSLLKMSNVAGAPVAVMSSEVMINSSVGFTPSKYWLSSAFCVSKIHISIMINQTVSMDYMNYDCII